MSCGVQIPKTTQEVGYGWGGQGAKLPLEFSTLGPGSSGNLPDPCSARASVLATGGKSPGTECREKEWRTLTFCRGLLSHKFLSDLSLPSLLFHPQLMKHLKHVRREKAFLLV